MLYTRAMEESTERPVNQVDKIKKPHFLRRHLILVICIPTLIIASVLFVVITDHRERVTSESRKVALQKELTAIDERAKAVVKEKKLAAQRAEAEARAKAEKDAAEAKKKAAAKPAGTAPATPKCDVTNPSSITAVLNKKHCFSPIDWAPTDLVTIKGYPLRHEAASQLQALMNAAQAEGLQIDISSAYRSYADQQSTYRYWVNANGSQAAADTISARPGYSEHQTGLVVDLKVGSCYLECFGSTAQYTWLTQHAADYGFIRRYPDGMTSITGYSPESWHWRYVGVAVAKDMKAKGVETMEKYFGISGGDYQ